MPKNTRRKPKPSPEHHKAWLEARIAHYARTRSPECLARMLVEAEEHGKITPEFAFDEAWPD
jgi:hypothetical protein